MISAIRKRLEDKEEGFTLIELLVVVIIIGILAAIAIPVFLNQRERAWERAVMSDLRNASVVLEEVFSDDGSYAAFTGPYAGGAEGTGFTITTANGTDLTYTVSRFVTVTVVSADATGYVLEGTHENLETAAGADRVWELDSATGSVQETT